MKEFEGDIEQLTVKNSNFRKVIFTGKAAQLVLMSLLPGEDIGMETHPHTDQFIRVEEGDGKAIINGNAYTIGSGDAVVIPQGSPHNIMNVSTTKQLKLYTVYSKPEHPANEVAKTKVIAILKEPKDWHKK